MDRGTYLRILRKIEALQRAGVHFGVIVVLTPLTIGPEAIGKIVAHLTSLGVKGIGFNYCHEIDTDGKPTPLSITASDYAQAILEAFNVWLERDDPMLRIREIDERLAVLLGRQPISGCSASKCESFITIDANGDVYPCDCFYQTPGAYLGNLTKESLSDILEGPQWGYWRQAVFNKLYQECDSCAWFTVCRGGCSHERFFYDRLPGDRSEYCGLRQGVLSGMLRRLRNIRGALL
jgi:uncharacterized protein